ncbi:MAG: hypothetical protein HY822_15965 [Acidobacteria bacterium]|nr:hypothetical protein [Acidobacteriota bacterium]
MTNQQRAARIRALAVKIATEFVQGRPLDALADAHMERIDELILSTIPADVQMLPTYGEVLERLLRQGMRYKLVRR